MKSKWFKWSGLSILVVLAALLATRALAAAGDTTRVSVASDGTEGNYPSWNPVMSADRHYVVFDSDASNLVGGDTNGERDVFLRDMQTRVTSSLSVASDGTQGNGWSFSDSISADGRYVVFCSYASNLVSEDTNGEYDVFLRDIQMGITTRISVDSSGMQGNDGSCPASVSADGRYVAFSSNASNLVSGDTNNSGDVFLRDMQTGTTTRLSVSTDGTQGNDNSYSYTIPISADGRYVAFESFSINLVSGDINGRQDIFLRDTYTGITTLLSVASDGAQGNGDSYNPSLSSDGRYVAFESFANNLVSDDTNGRLDIFVRDIQMGITTRISLDSSGMQGNSWSFYPSISADGRYVAFESFSSNLVGGDTNGKDDIFLRDTQAGTTRRLSVDSNGTQANNWSDSASISADGRYVAFRSLANNLISGDTNGVTDIFIHETDALAPIPTPTPTPAALPSTGFAPQYSTVLSAQPSEKAYINFSTDSKQGLGDLWLEIPRLGVQMPIVGIPQVDGEWDVSWLGNQAGWLNGTAYPTWAGNSVLTGHVYDVYGKPGPFVDLNGLWWGDKVVVHAWGAQYVYEVRQVMQVAPGATSSVIKHEELPWVTLITCRGYDEASNSYKYRVVVRAVLLEVK